jgi:hypothetical protein
MDPLFSKLRKAAGVYAGARRNAINATNRLVSTQFD